MSNEHSINLFELRVTTRNKPEDYQFLDNVDGSRSDLLHLFGRFLQSLPADRMVARDKKHFGRVEDLTLAGRTVRAAIQCGTSGIESTLTAVDGTVKADRERPDVELLRFRLAMCVPTGSNVGFLAVEEVHQRTLTAEFRAEFIAQFNRACPRQILSIRACAREDAWKMAEEESNAVVQGIRIVRSTPSASAISGTGLGSLPSTAGKVVTEMSYRDSPFRATRLRSVRKEVDRMRGRGTDDNSGGVRSIDTVDETDVEDIDVVADVVLANGDAVKARYSNTRPPKISFEIDTPPSGEVRDDTFYSEARRHLRDLVEESGGALMTDWWETGWVVPESVPAMTIEVDSGIARDGSS